jgi:hypothetical protein
MPQGRVTAERLSAVISAWFGCSLPLEGLGGITAMTRLCILGLTAVVLSAGPARSAALDHANADSEAIARAAVCNREGEDPAQACAATRLAFDEPTGLPAAFLPEQNRSCVLGERVTISGTIEDVAHQSGGWSVGATARVDICMGLTDPSTGFGALFGDGKPPPRCEHRSRFWAPARQVTAFSRSSFSR